MVVSSGRVRLHSGGVFRGGLHIARKPLLAFDVCRGNGWVASFDIQGPAPMMPRIPYARHSQGSLLSFGLVSSSSQNATVTIKKSQGSGPESEQQSMDSPSFFNKRCDYEHEYCDYKYECCNVGHAGKTTLHCGLKHLQNASESISENSYFPGGGTCPQTPQQWSCYNSSGNPPFKILHTPLLQQWLNLGSVDPS